MNKVKKNFQYFLFLPYLDVELYSLFYLIFVTLASLLLGSFSKNFPSYYALIPVILLAIILVLAFYKFTRSSLKGKTVLYEEHLHFSVIFFIVVLILALTSSVEFVAFPLTTPLATINAIVCYLVLGRAIATLFATFVLPSETKQKDYEERVHKNAITFLDLVLILIFGSFFYSLLRLSHFTIATVAVLGYFYTSVSVLGLKKMISLLKLALKSYGPETAAKTA